MHQRINNVKFGKAGAGLPEFERLFIKLILIPFVRIVMNWQIVRLLIKRETKIIEELLNNISNEKLQEKMSISRIFAIEDNSRQFSVNEVLEHLVITGTLVKYVISSLSQEKKVDFDIKIENVKPKENKENQFEDFLVFYKNYDTFIKKLSKKQSKTTKAHPWFVKFNNFDWNIFMFMHTFIHRRQIQAILNEQKDVKKGSNSIGTIVIASFLLLTLLLMWFLFSTSIYFLMTIILGIDFSLMIALFIFLGMLSIKAVYPKNVFA